MGLALASGLLADVTPAETWNGLVRLGSITPEPLPSPWGHSQDGLLEDERDTSGGELSCSSCLSQPPSLNSHWPPDTWVSPNRSAELPRPPHLTPDAWTRNGDYYIPLKFGGCLLHCIIVEVDNWLTFFRNLPSSLDQSGVVGVRYPMTSGRKSAKASNWQGRGWIWLVWTNPDRSPGIWSHYPLK